MCDGDFLGKTVLITGSTRGIGKAIAEEFAKRKANVVLNFRKKVDIAQQTFKEIKEINENVILVQADVSDKERVNRLFEEAEKAFGSVDILVNNAGLGIAYPFTEYPDDLWDRLMNINLKSAVMCSKKATKYMIKKKWGRIINITSVAGLIGMMMVSPYAVAKAGMVGLTKVLAIELAPYNITVNAIASGMVKTKLGMAIFDLLSQSSDKSADVLAEIWAKKHTLIGRLLQPYEIARMVTFLAEEGSSGITGQIYIIDGGQTIVEGRINIEDLIS